MRGRRTRAFLVMVIAVTGLAAAQPTGASTPDAGGYQLAYLDVGIEADYTVRISTAGYGWQFIVDEVAEVAAQASAATGASIVVGSNVTGTTAAPGEIVVTTTSSCSDSAYGCARPDVVEGRIRSAFIHIQPGYVDSPLTLPILLHEMGHALGLDHYGDFFEGQIQIMYPQAAGPDVTTYRSGDLNGLARVAANGFASDIPGAPGSPTNVQGAGHNGSAHVFWTAPTSIGTSPITGYVVTAHPGGATCSTSGALACDVHGLAGGQSYTFTVRAINAAGPSPASGHSWAVHVEPPLEPSAPTAVTATPGDASATVSWHAAESYSFPIESYTVTASPGGATCSTNGELTCIVGGLTNGQPYTFTVTAANGWGVGPASAPSATVTPNGPVTFIARYDAATCQTLHNIGDAMGGTSADVIRVGVNAIADVTESDGAFTIEPPANDGPCEIPVTVPSSEVERLSDTAAAWGIDNDQLHHLGGVLVIVVIIAIMQGG